MGRRFHHRWITGCILFGEKQGFALPALRHAPISVSAPMIIASSSLIHAIQCLFL